MKTKHLFKYLYVVLLPLSANGQGTFVYDQQSADENTGGGVAVAIQANQPIGQSFTPTLASIGFIRLKVYDDAFDVVGATVYVVLRSDSITGAIVASTTPVVLPDGAVGPVNFYFPMPVSVTPNQTYYFQPIVETGPLRPPWGVDVYDYHYAGGTAFNWGVATPGYDLWFREGIVVPEPSTWVLLVIGLGVLACRRRKCP